MSPFTYPSVPPPRSTWKNLTPCDMKYIDPKFHDKIKRFTKYENRKLTREASEHLFYHLLNNPKKTSKMTPTTLCKLYNQCATMFIKRGKFGRAAEMYNSLIQEYKELHGSGHQRTVWAIGQEILMQNKQEKVNINIRKAKERLIMVNKEKEREMTEQIEKDKKKEEKKARKKRKQEETDSSEEENGEKEN